jgi:hypothetical protein
MRQLFKDEVRDLCALLSPLGEMRCSTSTRRLDANGTRCGFSATETSRARYLQLLERAVNLRRSFSLNAGICSRYQTREHE